MSYLLGFLWGGFSENPVSLPEHNVWHRTITSSFSLSGWREGRMEGGWTDRRTDGWMNTEWTMPPRQANAIHQVRDIFVLSCQNLEGTTHCLLHLCPHSSRPWLRVRAHTHARRVTVWSFALPGALWFCLGAAVCVLLGHHPWHVYQCACVLEKQQPKGSWEWRPPPAFSNPNLTSKVSYSITSLLP